MNSVFLFFSLLLPTDRVEDEIRISKTYPVDNKELTLLVDNIFGSIKVEASKDDQIHLDLVIELSASSESLLAKAKKELQLGEEISNDSILLFTKAPFIKRCKWDGLAGFNMGDGPKYEFKYQYVLSVPSDLSIYAKTVDNGDVTVSGISGIVKAYNVNGDVTIEKARDVRDASTVNGKVFISLLQNFQEDVEFNTVNGDFEFELPEDFSAKIFFDSMNGDLYTSFDYKKLSPRVEKSDEEGRFKVGTKTGVEIGSDGPELSFTSINGNVYLRKAGTR